MRVSFLGGVLLLACACAAHAQTTTQPIQSEMDLLRQENTTLRAQIVELQHEISELRAGHSATTKPATSAKTQDPELKAGMTLAEANKMMGSSGHDVGRVTGEWMYEWSINGHTYRAQFSNGALIRWAKQ